MQIPSFLKWLYKMWMKFSHALGFVMSRILLTILWIVGIGLYGIILQIIEIFRGKQQNTEWHSLPPQTQDSLTTQY